MHEKQIEIRWRDQDPFGHVNNAVYLTYLEEVRDEWLERTLGSGDELWDFVIARVEIDFRRELTQADDSVLARCELQEIGRSAVRTPRKPSSWTTATSQPKRSASSSRATADLARRGR